MSAGPAGYGLSHRAKPRTFSAIGKGKAQGHGERGCAPFAWVVNQSLTTEPLLST